MAGAQDTVRRLCSGVAGHKGLMPGVTEALRTGQIVGRGPGVSFCLRKGPHRASITTPSVLNATVLFSMPHSLLYKWRWVQSLEVLSQFT